MAPKQPSIYDIAQIAGISAGSVSKILNGKGSFSEKTRAAVLEIARREGYVANVAARNLRTQSTKTVGIVTPDVSNEFYSSIILHAEEALRGKGYISYIANHHNEAEREAEIVADLVRRRVDGLLLVGGHRSFDPAGMGVDVPVACVDRGVAKGPKAAFAGNDVGGITRDATTTLLDHGCTRVAFLSVIPFAGSKADRRLAGYKEALADAGIALDKNLILEGPSGHARPALAEGILGACLDDGHEVDGVVCMGDRVAVHAITELSRRGIAVGRDVLVIGMDNSVYTRFARLRISSVERHVDQLASRAVEQLLPMMAGEEPQSKRVIVPHEIVERETTRGRV